MVCSRGHIIFIYASCWMWTNPLCGEAIVDEVNCQRWVTYIETGLCKYRPYLDNLMSLFAIINLILSHVAFMGI